MASVNEYLIQIQELTKTNLEILSAINKSFTSKNDHLTVSIADSTYVIPSFISLENKINSLNDNFYNLVHSPETGEAFFNFDGDSRAISVRSYTTVPNSLKLNTIENFHVENNDIFKDFLTPNPFVKINTFELPNDITKVNVKKIIPITSELKDWFRTNLGNSISINMNYSDVYKKVYAYKQDVDYVEYDTIVSLPIRKNIGSGIYVIEKVLKDEIEENLDNYITIKVRSDLSDRYMSKLYYKLFDETIEKPLNVGDQLLSYNGNTKLEIVEIYQSTNILKLKVLHGEYLNLMDSNDINEDRISNNCKLKFFSPVNFDEDKYVPISLEEDEFIFIAIAGLNERMNVQSSWGTGLMIHTNELRLGNDKESKKFESYYKENVRNIGDLLFEMMRFNSNTLTNLSGNEFESVTNYKPEIIKDDLLVTQINKHLNNSTTIQNIRSLYNQKKDYQDQLNQINSQINDLNSQLSTISFDDTTGVRTAYVAQITDLSSQANDLDASITKVINEITIAANNSEIPIENAKYRIRGYFSSENLPEELKRHIIGIRVQYRYKNIEQTQGNALSINDKFIFSDWNDMQSFDRERIPVFENNSYNYKLTDKNDKINEPSFNQIDIPITQGEIVDIRIKLLYDYGFPFVKTYSDWSSIVNIEFPSEYLKNVQILDIIEENNNDIEKLKLKTTFDNEGITAHIHDKLIDQDITYYHNPENISSGFYTSERRIIPLKDKLSAMDISITELRDEILGSSSDALTVSIKHGESENILYPYQTNNISVASYDSFGDENPETEGIYEKTGKLITTILNISIKNTSDHTMKLFSLFPGNRDTQLGRLKNYKYRISDYCHMDDKANLNTGVWFEHPCITPDTNIETNADDYLKVMGYENEGEGLIVYSGVLDYDDTDDQPYSIQSGNQYIYFRIKDINDGELYYGSGNQSDKINKLSWDKQFYKYDAKFMDLEEQGPHAFMYPKVGDRYALHLDSNKVGDFMTLAPAEEIIIPIVFEYYIPENHRISKIMSFDLCTSLFRDPVTYTFKVNAKYSNTSLDKVLSLNHRKFKNWWNLDKTQYRTNFK